jgi:hypothetical protein
MHKADIFADVGFVLSEYRETAGFGQKINHARTHTLGRGCVKTSSKKVNLKKFICGATTK